MDFKTVEDYILTFRGATKSKPYDNDVVVYSVQVAGREEPEMFALVESNKDPLRVSLRCDYKLSALLRERYETVMPGNRLNQKIWNTVILTGQLPWDEVQDLIRLSYNLTTGQA